MRYIIRAIKYFLYISVLFSLIIGILVLAGVVSADINVMFKNGWKSVGYILLLFAAVAAVYPNFGYGKFAVNAGGEYKELRDKAVAFMESRHYVLEKEEGEDMSFRSTRTADRILKVWEDRITLKRRLGGFEIEGLTRDTARLRSALEKALERAEDTEEN